MKTNHGRILTVLLAALVVLAGANLAAYAANGGPLLAGATNTATKTTTIKNTKGTALKLAGKSNKPVLKVSNSQKISKLNADQLDGLDSAALQNRPYVVTLTGAVGAAAINFTITGVPAGDYQVTYNVSGAAGGAPTWFGCFLVRTAAPTLAFLPQLGSSASPGQFFVSAAGTYTVVGGGAEALHCSTNGTSIAVPLPLVTAQIVFTRIDGSSTGSAAGSPARTSARSAFR